MTASAVTTYFQVLYTPNLTQKRKKWFDGQLVFNAAQHKAKLLDVDSRLLAEDRYNPHDVAVGSQHQIERFLVEIDSVLRTVINEAPIKPLNDRVPLASRSNSVPKSGSLILPDMGPSLAEVLPAVGRLTPINLTETASNRIAEPVVTKRRKYAPWGDVKALLAPPPPIYEHATQPDAANTANFEQPFVTDPKIAPYSSPNGHTSAQPAPSFEQDELLFYDDLDSDLVVPESYDLNSDLESDVEVLETAPASHKSLFTDLPSSTPLEGPWTKEAYLLFSWHPPVVKHEVE